MWEAVVAASLVWEAVEVASLLWEAVVVSLTLEPVAGNCGSESNTGAGSRSNTGAFCCSGASGIGAVICVDDG